jgi:hypothetical protein
MYAEIAFVAQFGKNRVRNATDSDLQAITIADNPGNVPTDVQRRLIGLNLCHISDRAVALDCQIKS